MRPNVARIFNREIAQMEQDCETTARIEWLERLRDEVLNAFGPDLESIRAQFDALLAECPEHNTIAAHNEILAGLMGVLETRATTRRS